jgi:2-oxoacid:acceptor oxidoreductase gamma subunit (pyruvate/2-ketoisovalerate family)
MEIEMADSKDMKHKSSFCTESDATLPIALPLEIRVHGRGGQGGVTCAKLCALVYSSLGLYAQTFGDYGLERAGAPVRAYTRVDRSPIKNRNKVYTPDHLLILDPTLLGQDVLDGVRPGALILLNTSSGLSAYEGMYEQYRFAVVNATNIARTRGIGSSAVVIVNTSIVGAYARLVGLPITAIEQTYSLLKLQNDIGAAQDAYHSVAVREAGTAHDVGASVPTAPAQPAAQVIPLPDHTSDMPTPVKTGSWRTQSPLHKAGLAPCNAACPAGNDVVGFIQALKSSGVADAARVLLNEQPLPAVCGRVCPAPCMTSCNRAFYDGSVNIRGLERWVGEHAIDGILDRDRCTTPRNVAVVGGGPAGLGAAFVLARAGHEVTIYEIRPKLGGVLWSAIPSYRLPQDALERDIGRILALGVNTKCGESVDASRVQALSAEYDAVVVATGQAFSRIPDSPGAEFSGIEQGLEFLYRVKNQGHGKLSGTVIVIGGGNTAVDCARTALRCGAAKVTLVYRRGREEMPAIGQEIQETMSEGIELVLYRQPVRFLGESRVTGIEFAEMELGDPDASGRKRPIATDRLSVISCDHVLLAVGQYSDLRIFPAEWQIRQGRSFRSEQPLNVWLAGDLTTAAGTVAHAVGHGKSTARDMLRFFEHGLSCAQVPEPKQDIVKPEDIRFSHFPVIERHEDLHRTVSSRISGFEEVNLGLADVAEAERCFSCGHCTECDTCMTYCPEGIIGWKTGAYVINEEYCKGCGICVWECPRHAMQMTAGG